MRYKVIYFYLPMNYAMIGSRIHHFEIESESSIISEHPGSVYSDDFRDYYRVDNTDIYRASTTDYPSNFFVKIVEESDPMFNFDYAYGVCNDADMVFYPSYSDEKIYTNILVEQFIGSRVLSMER